MKLAYLILAHKAPAQLLRLVDRLGDAAAIVIHFDAHAGRDAFEALVHDTTHRPNVVLLPRRPCVWGDFSLVQATLDGLAWLVDHDADYDKCVLLSGQDYPIKPPAAITAALAAAPEAIHLQVVSTLTPEHRWRMSRLVYWYPRIFGRRRQVPPKGLDRVVRLRRHIPGGLAPYNGSQFWCLSRTGVEYVSRFTREHPAYVSFFQGALVPDEAFFHTLVMNSPLRRHVLDQGIHFIDWPADHAVWHPVTLTAADVPRLLRSPYLFARKFDAEVDPAVFDLLDRAIQEQVTTDGV